MATWINRSYRRMRSYRPSIETLEQRNLLSVVPTGEIRGTVWQDLDGDGLRSSSEPGMAGVTVYLDSNANGWFDADERGTLTADDDPQTPDVDESGTYAFTDLEPGLYRVAQYAPDGFVPTSPHLIPELPPASAGGSGGSSTGTMTLGDVIIGSGTLRLPLTSVRLTVEIPSTEPITISGGSLQITGTTTISPGTSLTGGSLTPSDFPETPLAFKPTPAESQNIPEETAPLTAILPPEPELAPVAPGTHAVYVEPGQVAEGVDFGNRAILNLGTVDFYQSSEQEPVGRLACYALRAARDGILTVELTGGQDGDANGITLAVCDNAGNVLKVAEGQTRVDYADAKAGHPYLLAVTAVPDMTLRVANLVCQQGETLAVFGTPYDDLFEFAAQVQPASSLGSVVYRLGINGVQYDFAYPTVPPTSVSVSFDGGQGDDVALLTGSRGDDTAQLTPNGGSLTGPGYAVQLDNVSHIAVQAGAGGNDVAHLFDSAGDDSLAASPGDGLLSGSGFALRALGFDYLHAYGSAGGHDKATLDGSNGRDTLVASPQSSVLRGPGYYNRAKYFEEVIARSGLGQSDTAQLSGSKRDDTFIANPMTATLSGPGFSLVAQQFRSVTAIGVGGTDIAHLHGSTLPDTFDATPQCGKLSARGYYLAAASFDYVHAYGVGANNDTALFHDSPGADKFVGRTDYSTLSGSGYFLRAKRFRAVTALASEGRDVAYLYDSAGADTLVASSTQCRLSGNGYSNTASAFDEVYARASRGFDRAELTGSAWDDLLVAAGRSVKLQSSNPHVQFLYEAWGFDSVRVKSTTGRDTTRIASDVQGLELVDSSVHP